MSSFVSPSEGEVPAPPQAGHLSIFAQQGLYKAAGLTPSFDALSTCARALRRRWRWRLRRRRRWLFVLSFRDPVTGASSSSRVERSSLTPLSTPATNLQTAAVAVATEVVAVTVAAEVATAEVRTAAAARVATAEGALAEVRPKNAHPIKPSKWRAFRRRAESESLN